MVDDDQEEEEDVGEEVRCASTWNGNKCSRKKSASFVLKFKWSFGGNPRPGSHTVQTDQPFIA